MDQRYGPQQINPEDWDDVDQKVSTLKNISLGDALAWALAGVILVAGAWQSMQPIHRVPPERGSAV